MDIEQRMMERALQLASYGLGQVSPNPMVGAVIVHHGRIIGEGWHRRYGEGHAEVNAVASVGDKSLLADSTMYVTLEPCSHYGKTPPCAKLIIDSKIPRVVVATLDPFEKVSGRGVAMLREAGVEVEVGLLGEESRRLNKTFFTAHTLHRPYVMLKWAQSADGFLDRRRQADEPAARFSTDTSSIIMHRLRSCFDAIMVGSGTVIADNPRLDVRGIEGRSPVKVVLDRRGRIDAGSALFDRGRVIYFGPQRSDINAETVTGAEAEELDQVLSALYRRGVTSLMVEGGKALLDAFIAAGLWDECRVEVSPTRLGDQGRCRMSIPAGTFAGDMKIDENLIVTVENR